MTTIAGSALDLDLLGTNTTENNNNKNNAASSSRPSSRLARHSSDDQQQPGENKDENKNKNSIVKCKKTIDEQIGMNWVIEKKIKSYYYGDQMTSMMVKL